MIAFKLRIVNLFLIRIFSYLSWPTTLIKIFFPIILFFVCSTCYCSDGVIVLTCGLCCFISFILLFIILFSLSVNICNLSFIFSISMVFMIWLIISFPSYGFYVFQSCAVSSIMFLMLLFLLCSNFWFLYMLL